MHSTSTNKFLHLAAFLLLLESDFKLAKNIAMLTEAG